MGDVNVIKGFSGEIRHDGGCIAYKDGLVAEEHNNKTQTTYKYYREDENAPVLLSSKKTRYYETNITITNKYFYTEKGDLLQDVEQMFKDDELQELKTLTYINMGNGQYGCTITLNGKPHALLQVSEPIAPVKSYCITEMTEPIKPISITAEMIARAFGVPIKYLSEPTYGFVTANEVCKHYHGDR